MTKVNMTDEPTKILEVSEKRKASDILLALENKVDTLIKVISAYDMNTKLILDRVNFIYTYIKQVQALDEAQLSAPPVSMFPEQPVQTSTEHIITEEIRPDANQRRTPRSDFFVMPTQAEAQKPQQIVQDASSDRKVPVTQRVTDGSGKDLFMAEVNIVDEQKSLVMKTKTNATGKWQAYLKPGKYSVNVVKTDTSTKRKIEATQEINISNANTSAVTTLPVIIIKR